MAVGSSQDRQRRFRQSSVNRPPKAEPETFRRALRHFALAPSSRDLDRPSDIAAALPWLENTSLLVGEFGMPQHSRAVLDAISVKQDGLAASATTIARKRSVFATLLRYAVKFEELTANPLDRLHWKPPQGLRTVDRRWSTSARPWELLTAVRPATPRSACARPAAHGAVHLYGLRRLRPGEAVALRRQGCYLPETGWAADPEEIAAPTVLSLTLSGILAAVA